MMVPAPPRSRGRRRASEICSLTASPFPTRTSCSVLTTLQCAALRPLSAPVPKTMLRCGAAAMP